MESYISYIGSNPWLSIFSFILAALSVIFAIYFYKKSIRKRKPCYSIKSYKLVREYSNIIDGLEMIYNGKKIKNFTISKIAFWNSGNATINKDDIVPRDPISIIAKNSNIILDAKIIASNNDKNGFSLDKKPDQTYIGIDFDYIDRYNGVAIELYHTGTSDDDIEFCGQIKGEGKVNRISLDPGIFKSVRDLSPLILPPVFMLYIIINIIVYISAGSFNLIGSVVATVVVLYGALFIFSIISIFMARYSKEKYNELNLKYTRRMNRFTGREPAGLEIIEEI